MNLKNIIIGETKDSKDRREGKDGLLSSQPSPFYTDPNSLHIDQYLSYDKPVYIIHQAYKLDIILKREPIKDKYNSHEETDVYSGYIINEREDGVTILKIEKADLIIIACDFLANEMYYIDSDEKDKKSIKREYEENYKKIEKILESSGSWKVKQSWIDCYDDNLPMLVDRLIYFKHCQLIEKYEGTVLDYKCAKRLVGYGKFKHNI